MGSSLALDRETKKNGKVGSVGPNESAVRRRTPIDFPTRAQRADEIQSEGCRTKNANGAHLIELYGVTCLLA